MGIVPFITLEGGEGAGKSTQIRLLKEWLESRGTQVIATREPGGTIGAEEIRNLIVRNRDSQWDAETDTLLFMAARRDHLVHVIWPALDAGKWVLCDRFADSTFAYQCFGRGLDLEKARMMYQFIAGDFKPHLTFLLDLDPSKGMERVMAGSDRNTAETRFENFDISFHENLRSGFHQLAKDEPDRFVIVNADTDQNNLQAQLRAEIEKRFLS